MISRNKGWVLDLSCSGCLYDVAPLILPPGQEEGLQSYSVATSPTRITDRAHIVEIGPEFYRTQPLEWVNDLPRGPPRFYAT